MKKSPKLKWLVIRTKHGQERRACAKIEHLDHESYSPRFREYGRVKALFPSYSFARVNPQNWGFVKRINGIFGVLMAGEHPSFIPDSVINEIKSREIAPNLVDLKKGFTFRQRLAIVGGPFREGLYLGMSDHRRVKVLFEILGRETAKDIDIKRVRPAEAD